MMKITPDKADFCQMAAQYSVVPVYCVFATDLETPISLYYKMADEDVAFLLESAQSSKAFGRYSFLGARPFANLTARKNQTTVKLDDETLILDAPPLTAITSFQSRFSCPALPDLAPFSGGGVGYFSYDAVATWERVRGKSISAEDVLAELVFCQVIIIMDHLTHSTTLVYLVLPKPGQDLQCLYQAAVNQLAVLAEKITRPAAGLPETRTLMPVAAQSVDFNAAAGKKRYIDMVKKAQQYIEAGDAFQIVLSHRFTVDLPDVSPFSLYRKLRRVNPSPYMFYLQFGGRCLVGASPEMLVKVNGRQVFTCPIAGTRPRGRDSDADEKLAAELLADEKERAEHSMLVDLGRNDLGRISEPGTVKVTRFLEVEQFSHVMHLVSEVAGKLDSALCAMDALAACFPAGTVSGAPKIRAMEIIEELEAMQRGIYAGAVGYLDFNGNMDTCITIRTMLIEDGKVSIQAGAGIVADSVAETEYQEVLHKAKALFKVIEEV